MRRFNKILFAAVLVTILTITGCATHYDLEDDRKKKKEPVAVEIPVPGGDSDDMDRLD